MALKLEPVEIHRSARHGARVDIQHLYRAVADDEPRREILEMLFDLFGDSCELRPPVDELNLARRCGAVERARG